MTSDRSDVDTASRGGGFGGAYADPATLHREVDEAIADCYGWPRGVAQDDVEQVARLLDLNRLISTGERSYDPFRSSALTWEFDSNKVSEGTARLRV